MSTDGGITWSSRNTGLQGKALVVLGFLLDPRQPQTLYAVTFAGAYKSTDAGAHWRQIFGGVSHLTMDPTNSNTLYAGSTGGLLKTTDGGATWHGAGNDVVGVAYSISVDPLHPDTVYVGTQGTSASSIVIRRSSRGRSSTIPPLTPRARTADNRDSICSETIACGCDAETAHLGGA